jgi:hypothetical protein
MYYDDNFHPTDANDYEPSVTGQRSVVSESTASTRLTESRKKQRKMLEELKKADKGYHVKKCMVNGKRVKIEMYSTNTFPGNRIRDPLSGSYDHYQVGSPDEDLYFKVRSTSVSDGNTIVTLYYDSPDSYEKHQYTTISPEAKLAWQIKRARYTVNK